MAKDITEMMPGRNPCALEPRPWPGMALESTALKGGKRHV